MPLLTLSARRNSVACITMICITAITVSMRFLVRFCLHQKPLGSDWTCLLSTVFFYVWCALILNFIFNASEFYAFDDDIALGMAEMTSLTKSTYTCEIIFGCGITLVKLSILWFYHTIFAVEPMQRRIITATAVACSIWFIAVTFVIIFQCNPVDAFWSQIDPPPNCLSTPRVLLGHEITNLFLDVIILCIPIGTIPRLHLPTSQKVTILGIFLLGTFVCIASILRLIAIWHPPDVDQNFDFSFTFFWATVQLGLAIVCSCLPTLGPLLRPFCAWCSPYVQYLYGLIKSYAYTSSALPRAPSSGAERTLVQVGEDRLNASSETWAYRNNVDGSYYALRPIPSKTILVDREVNIV